MLSELMGEIYRLIHRGFMENIIVSCNCAESEAEQRKEQLRKCAEIMKHDIPIVIDAEAEAACKLIDGRLIGRTRFTGQQNEER